MSSLLTASHENTRSYPQDVLTLMVTNSVKKLEGLLAHITKETQLCSAQTPLSERDDILLRAVRCEFRCVENLADRLKVSPIEVLCMLHRAMTSWPGARRPSSRAASSQGRRPRSAGARRGSSARAREKAETEPALR